MSHHPNVISSPGTAMTDRTVGELVAEAPGRSRVFQQHQIDFCCQGGRTLREACEKKQVDLNSVVAAIKAEDESGQSSIASNPAELPPGQLVDYIVDVHHGFLNRELPRLQAMSQRVAQVHGGHTASLIELDSVFTNLLIELVSHMKKEEEILFPAIKTVSGDSGETTSFPQALVELRHEHDEVGRALEQLRELTGDYSPPSDACNTYRALFGGLSDLEEDLHRHIHLENQVLFPAAEALLKAVA